MVQNFKKNQELLGHKDSSIQVVWDPSHNDKVASIGADGYVRVWDTRSEFRLFVLFETFLLDTLYSLCVVVLLSL
jgi:WD40 repeat protein